MMSQYENIKNKIDNLNSFIEYLYTTTDDQWCVDVVRSQCEKKNCLFGHLIDYVYGKDYKGDITEAWNYFEIRWANTYIIYPINDGENNYYNEPTPKLRCIKFLENLRDGIEETTLEGLDRCYKAWLQENQNV